MLHLNLARHIRLSRAGVASGLLRKFSRMQSRVSGQDGGVLVVSPEVQQALEHGRPIVALESTIITHGMPWPNNMQTALDVEHVVREQGAVPATICVLAGRLTVGLSQEQLEHLAKPRNNSDQHPLKVSRRDIPYVLANKLDGGTTVAGTMIAANMAGIPIFATGGIGGVHRGGEHSMDISADLVELGRTPVSVVCAGVKSILDIARTLEYLETQGVPVAVLGPSKLFPAFYARSHGGLVAPQHLHNVQQAAKLVAMSRAAGLCGGSLIAVPVPEEYAMDEQQMDAAIASALQKASAAGVRGKEVTPFLLKAITEITQGRSLQTNIALIKNNAKIGAQIAVELAKEERICNSITKNNVTKISQNVVQFQQKRSLSTLSPVVIGGSNADIYIKVQDPDIKLDGGTYSCHSSSVSGGGVGRNIAEALCKLGATPRLISAVGTDSHGKYLDSLLPEECSSTVERLSTGSTANCTIILDRSGECKLFLGDMSMHNNITVDLIKRHENVIEKAPMVILDSNIPLDTMKYVLQTAHRLHKPVFYEPTDLRKAGRIFEFPLPSPLAFCSPNLAELRVMAASLNTGSEHNKFEKKSSASDKQMICEELRYLCETVLSSGQVDVLVVTLGQLGVAIARRGNANLSIDSSGKVSSGGNTPVRLYSPPKIEHLINTSGAGDCFVAGFIMAKLRGLEEANSVAVASMAASLALNSATPVPAKLFDASHPAWKNQSQFDEMFP